MSLKILFVAARAIACSRSRTAEQSPRRFTLESGPAGGGPRLRPRAGNKHSSPTRDVTPFHCTLDRARFFRTSAEDNNHGATARLYCRANCGRACPIADVTAPHGVSQPANTGSLAGRQVLRSDPLPEFGIAPAMMGIRHAKYPTCRASDITREIPKNCRQLCFSIFPESSFSDRSGRASADLRHPTGGAVVSTVEADHPKIRQVVKEQNSWRPILHRGACPGGLDHEGPAPPIGSGEGRVSATL
jgi:hypothetical protein